MANGYDIWGVIAGVLGILGFFPLLYAILMSQLPSSKLRNLDQILTETTSLFRTVCEEGLLRDTTCVSELEGTLMWIYHRTEGFRADTHRADTLYKEVVEWYRGTSSKISMLYAEVKKIRAKISAASAEERNRILEQGGTLPSMVAGVSGHDTHTNMSLISYIRSQSLGMHFSRTDGATIVPDVASVSTRHTYYHSVCDTILENPEGQQSSHTLSSRPNTCRATGKKPTRKVFCAKPSKKHQRTLQRLMPIKQLSRALETIDHDLFKHGQRHPLLTKLIHLSKSVRLRPLRGLRGNPSSTTIDILHTFQESEMLGTFGEAAIAEDDTDKCWVDYGECPAELTVKE